MRKDVWTNVMRHGARPAIASGVAAGLPLAGAITLAAYATVIIQQIAAMPLPVAMAVVAIIAGLLAGLALMPTHAVSLLAGYLLGPVVGGAVALTAVTIAAILGRRVGRVATGSSLATAWQSSPRWSVLQKSLLRASPKRTALLVGLIRLSPIAPFAMTNVILAAIGVPLWPYVIGSVLGLAPRVIAVALLGAGMAHFDLTETASAHWLVIGIAATVLAIAIMSRVAQQTIQSQLNTTATSPSTG